MRDSPPVHPSTAGTLCVPGPVRLDLGKGHFFNNYQLFFNGLQLLFITHQLQFNGFGIFFVPINCCSIVLGYFLYPSIVFQLYWAIFCTHQLFFNCFGQFFVPIKCFFSIVFGNFPYPSIVLQLFWAFLCPSIVLAMFKVYCFCQQADKNHPNPTYPGPLIRGPKDPQAGQMIPAHSVLRSPAHLKSYQAFRLRCTCIYL